MSEYKRQYMQEFIPRTCDVCVSKAKTYKVNKGFEMCFSCIEFLYESVKGTIEAEAEMRGDFIV